jgi:rod shape-determining protein MreC
VAISRRPRRSRLTLALLIITSIIVLTLDFRDTGVVGTARDVAASALAPVRGAVETATRPVSNAWNGITGYGDLEAENEELRARLDEIEGERARNEDAADQLGVILAQQGIEWVGNIETSLARVVAGSISNFADTVDIDKGTDHGISEGMPVVTGAGLVGIVEHATGSRSTVRLLSDPDFRVGVRRVPEGTLGTARGTGRADRMLVDSNLDPDERVRPRSLITTSGADRSRFPASIPVGRVVESRESTTSLTLELVIEPMVDVTSLSYVTVLLREPPG